MHNPGIIGSGGAGTGFGGGLAAYPRSLTVNARSEPVTELTALKADTVLAYTTRVTTSSGGNWLSVAPALSWRPSFGLSLSPPSREMYEYVGLTMDATGVPVGRHFGRVEFETTLGTLIFPVTFNVARTGPGDLRVSAKSLDFPGKEGGTTASKQRVEVTSPAGSIGFSVQLPSGKPWLTVSQSSPRTPAALEVKVDAEGQAPGVHSAAIVLLGSDGYSQQTVQVTLTVPAKHLSLAPTSLAFTAAPGAVASPQTLAVAREDGETKWIEAWVSTDSGGPWLSAAPDSDKTPVKVKVTASAAGLPPGTYSGTILIDTEGGQARVPVRFTVPPGANPSAVSEPPAIEEASSSTSIPAGASAAGAILVGPAALQFSGIAGGDVPRTQQVQLKTSGNPVEFTASASSTWLSVEPPSGTIAPGRPATLTVYADPVKLPAGTHSGSVLISSGGEAVAVPVTFTVGGAGGEFGSGGGLTASPHSLIMSAPPQSTKVLLESIALSSDGALPFTAFPLTATGGDWLSVTQSRGTAPATLHIYASSRFLPTGSHSGTVVVSTALGVLLIPVTFNVGPSPPAGVHVSPSLLEFGGTTPSVRSLYVTSLTGQPMAFTAEVGKGYTWISLSRTSGTTPATVEVTVDPAERYGGVHQNSILIDTSDGLRQTMDVKLPPKDEDWLRSPYSLRLTAAAGGTAPAQSLAAVGFDLMPFAYSVWTSASSDGSWLSITPNSGVSPGPVRVTASAARLSPGTYTATILVLRDLSKLTIPVTFTVTQTANVTVAPESLAFEAVAGATSIPAKTLDVGISLGRVQFTAEAATTSGGRWLQVTPASGMTPGKVTVTVNPAGLTAGTYSGTVTVDVAGATNSPRKVAVTLTIAPQPPAITAVLNAAAGAGGFLSAGTIGAIYGRDLGPGVAVFPQIAGGGLSPGPVGQVRVLVDDIPAVILYAQARQINFVVPWSLAGRATARVEVDYGGRRSAPAQIQLYDASPGIFSVDGSGLGQGAILNQDGSLNGTGNPAEGDSVVMLYATGMGQTEPESTDGAIPVETLPKPVLPVSVLIGSTEAEVLYAGAAPYLVSGAMQVNARIPRNLIPGSYLLTLRIGRFSSQRGITIAVK